MEYTRIVAQLLLEHEAVLLRPEQPFQFTSGILSPIYCDNRILISIPSARTQICNAFVQKIKLLSPIPDLIVGTATAGIPHAAWIAEQLEQPMLYVRSEAKKHGRQNQIEGRFQAGRSAIVIEDLISTGNSALQAALALREAYLHVTDCVAIFSYGFHDAEQNFQHMGVRLHTLTDLSTLLSVAKETGRLSSENQKLIQAWAIDPWGFGKTRH
ncbi:MAG: orotate phosphoribosyltransferase [Gammaproteobacteria bacterium RIFCSPHIGHO2_12_FULL_45_9]|nr:MAG: orotate phosphoribosyltransferase [Gammaproteobacteria bacterium RIFCSPHIGHO2_12_FULL_45_9]